MPMACTSDLSHFLIQNSQIVRPQGTPVHVKDQNASGQGQVSCALYQELAVIFPFAEEIPMVGNVNQKTLIGKLDNRFCNSWRSTPNSAAILFVFTGPFFPFMNLIYSTFFGESSNPLSMLMQTMLMGNQKKFAVTPNISVRWYRNSESNPFLGRTTGSDQAAGIIRNWFHDCTLCFPDVKLFHGLDRSGSRWITVHGK